VRSGPAENLQVEQAHAQGEGCGTAAAWQAGGQAEKRVHRGTVLLAAYKTLYLLC